MRLFRLWRTSGTDLRLLAAALRSPSRPAWLIPATAALAVFTFDPFNFALPVIGVIDDLILLPLLLRWLVRAAAAARRTPASAAAPRR
jgi:uncharacterized membrane protein YkvA (DUF1232 family)